MVSFDTLHRRVAGDANNDCTVNVLDMILIRDHMRQDPRSGTMWWFDVNNDGRINILDMILVRNHIGDTCGGELLF